MKHFFRGIAIVFLLAVLWALSCLVSHRLRDLSESPAEGNATLSVLTYNTQRMGNFRKVGNNEVIRYLQQADADVLCLQEVEVYKDGHYLTLPELRDAFTEYPYTYYDFKVFNSRRQYGNVVFSRYPLVNKHTIRYESRGNITSCCDVVVREDTLRLMVNHLESNRLSFHEQRDTLIEKMKIARKIRWKQALRVKKAMIQSPYPVIVVGDFNSLPVGLTYQMLKLGVRDCFLETSRWRLGLTYVHDLWGARIDYILCSCCLKPYRCIVDQVSASDHFPVIASIEWVPGSGNR